MQIQSLIQRLSSKTCKADCVFGGSKRVWKLLLVSASAGLLNLVALSTAQATLYAADNLTDNSLHGIVQFDGTLSESSAFISNGSITGLTTDGINVFASLPTGITEYTKSGMVVRSYANLNVDHFGALAIAGSTLLGADNLTDNSLHGIVLLNSMLQLTGSFITTSAVAGLATDGTSIYASLADGIYKYDMSGAILASYANLRGDAFGALSFVGGVLYAADDLTDDSLNGVVEFSSFLAKTGAFLTTGPIAGIAADGGHVYTSLPTGISEYTNVGALVQTYANLRSDKFGALALDPAVNGAVPEPATWAMILLGAGAAGLCIRRSQAVVTRVSHAA